MDKLEHGWQECGPLIEPGVFGGLGRSIPLHVHGD
jgi:hypothetical protein